MPNHCLEWDKTKSYTPQSVA